jgi:protein-tyrosine phosphatase
MDYFAAYQKFSIGWKHDPPARIYTNILFGPGHYLTPEFVIKHSITHVINCAFEEHSPFWFRRDSPSKYKCIQAEDSEYVDITSWFPIFETYMNTFLQEPNVKTVYVHCQCGINRSGFLCLLYACKKFKYSFDQSAKNILIQRPCALVNPTFKRQCKEYIKNLHTK